MAANCSIFGAALLVMMVMCAGADDNDFYRGFDIIWGGADGHVNIVENGRLLTISLDKVSGGAIRSKREFLFRRVEVKIKLIPGNSAGTVTSFYMSSMRPEHDEIDFEFLGNVSGEPYTIHTNVYTQGKGDREMQFKPWFDPTSDFHTYTILWNPFNIIFYVDGTPIRVFKNNEHIGVPFPKSKAMTLKSSLWNSDYWASQSGRVKTNWTLAPFIASFRDYGAGENAACSPRDVEGAACWMYKKTLSPWEMGKLHWVETNYLIYNYCSDNWRFSQQGLPPECTVQHC